MMPHKFNASRRHKFEKKRQKVTNWRVYNEGLRQALLQGGICSRKCPFPMI
jgi:hypothetical protein